MNRKTKIVLGVIAAVLVLGSLAPRLAHIERKQKLALPDELRSVALYAEDTVLRLRTTPERPHGLEVHNANRLGCAVDARLVLEDDRIEIHLDKGPISLRLWCDPQMVLRLPPELDFAIGLKKLVGDIKGDFGDIVINSENAVLDFDGTARTFALQGRRAFVRLNFASDMPRSDVVLGVDSIMSRITFNGAGRAAAFGKATSAYGLRSWW